MATTIYWRPEDPIFDGNGNIAVTIRMYADAAFTQPLTGASSQVLTVDPATQSLADMLAMAQGIVAARCAVENKKAAAAAKMTAIQGYAGSSVTA